MNTIVSRVLWTGLIFLPVFLSGFWVSHSGKPYRVFPFTAHKFIALGVLIYLGLTVFKRHQTASLRPDQILAAVVTGLFFAATIVTGGLVSIDKELPAFVSRLHHIAPYLTAVSGAATMALLL